jgi:glycerol-3-phosphate O-acyltransferase
MTLDREFGPLTRGFANRYFEDVRFPPEAPAELRALHEKGLVVHVQRTTSWINYLYLTWALLKNGLPPVRAVVNLRRWLTRPWRLTAQRGDFDVRFTYARRQGGSGLIFLKRSVFGTPHGKNIKEDPFPALVSLARRSETTVFLVPELFIWEKWNTRLKPVWADYVFGSPEAPGFLHTLMSFWRNRDRAQFRFGEPIDLKRFIEESPGDSDEKIARKVRGVLHHHLARETRAIFGPPLKPRERLIDETLRDRTLRKTLQGLSEETHRPMASLEREVRHNLDAIAANQHPMAIGVSDVVLRYVFSRIYEGIEVDEAGLDRAFKVASSTPLVLCASHKSHVDYLVAAWVLWRRGHQVPLIAAGANLSFFPLGPFLRRAGAFYLRRSFKGDPVYTASFKAYIKKLVHDGVHHQFFPEGGRSRTGKLLQPKLGMFTWEVEAILEGAREDLAFVPVSIDYEKVVESNAYREELGGGEKKPENLSGLLKTPKVLRASYGRLYLTFDTPVSLAALMRSRGVSPGQTLDAEQKKSLVRAVGHRVMYGISRVSTVTPQALLCTALLAHGQRGMESSMLSQRIGLLRRLVEADGAPLSRTLKDSPSDATVLGPLQEAANSFAEDGMLVISRVGETTFFQPQDERRVELSFYKNTLMNRLAPLSLVANAILAGEGRPTHAGAKERALWLSRLFKREFIYRVGMTFDVIFDENLARLVSLGLVVHEGERVAVAPERHAAEELAFLAHLLTDFLESYLVAAQTLQEAGKKGASDKKAFRRAALELGRQRLLAGRIKKSEALSVPTLENALAYFIEAGFAQEHDKTIALGPNADGGQMDRLVEELRSYLRALTRQDEVDAAA